MNKYTLSRKFGADELEETIEADFYEWDRLASNHAAIFYKEGDKGNQPVAYLSRIEYIKEEVK